MVIPWLGFPLGALLKAVAEATEYGLDYEALLKELLQVLHRIALAQADSALAQGGGDMLAHAQAMSPQDVQLYYQIGLMGSRDLPYAPDPRTGLEMTLLRMTAFRPAETGQAARAPVQPAPAATSKTAAPAARPVAAAPAAAPAATARDVPVPNPAPASNSASASVKWNDVVAQLDVAGLVREIAHNTTLESHENGAMVLVLDESRAQILNKEREAELKQALEKYYGAPLRLTLRTGRPAVETPAQEKTRVLDERQQAAVQAIADDPNVRALQEKFNARVNPASIRPKV